MKLIKLSLLTLFLSVSISCMAAAPKSPDFIYSADVEWENAEPGVIRQIMGYNDDIMMVVVSFEKGAVGALHSHPHTQATYVAEGEFEITIAGKTQTLKKGDCFLANPDVKHGAKCLKKGSLIDVFNPKRADFLK